VIGGAPEWKTLRGWNRMEANGTYGTHETYVIWAEVGRSYPATGLMKDHLSPLTNHFSRSGHTVSSTKLKLARRPGLVSRMFSSNSRRNSKSELLRGSSGKYS